MTIAEKLRKHADALNNGPYVSLKAQRDALREAADMLDKMESKIADAYQVVGVLTFAMSEYGINSDFTMSFTEEIRALDYFSSDEYQDDFLPWPKEG